MSPSAGKTTGPPSRLADLRNVGPAFLRDFDLLGVRTIDQLAGEDAFALHARLEALTCRRQDPCVIDVFLATIHEARTGEKTDWWDWTAERKRRRGP